MKVEKIADGAYAIPCYSEQTIVEPFKEDKEDIEPIVMDADRQKLELDIVKEFEEHL